jgi:transcriptional regulator with XRE-family HTH domain
MKMNKERQTNKDYWQHMIKRYQLSKRLRTYKEKNKLGYAYIANILKVKRQYVYAIEQMTIEPSQEFIDNLNQLIG